MPFFKWYQPIVGIVRLVTIGILQTAVAVHVPLDTTAIMMDGRNANNVTKGNMQIGRVIHHVEMLMKDTIVIVRDHISNGHALLESIRLERVHPGVHTAMLGNIHHMKAAHHAGMLMRDTFAVEGVHHASTHALPGAMRMERVMAYVKTVMLGNMRMTRVLNHAGIVMRTIILLNQDAHTRPTAPTTHHVMRDPNSKPIANVISVIVDPMVDHVICNAMARI